MGHDIHAYLGPRDPVGPLERLEDDWSQFRQVAYLRRGASDPLRHELYPALDAQDCAGDASGLWEGRWFDRQHLRRALERLQARLAEGVEVEPEIRFVSACLDALPADRSSVYVTFA